MPYVVVKEGETFEQAFRRFKKSVERTGILSELKKRQHYEPPSVVRKRKEAQARKRLMKKLAKLQQALKGA